MAFTVKNVIDRAREFLALDVDAAALRFSDTESISWVSDGQQEIVRQRPDSMDVSEVVLKDLDVIDELTDNLEIADRFIGTMVNYVIYRFFNKDDQDAENRQRSQLYFRRFQEGLQANG